MVRLGMIIPLALIGLSGTAMATDTPDDTSGLRASLETLGADGPTEASRAPSSRSSRSRKQTSTRGGKTVSRVQGQRRGDRSRAQVSGADKNTQRQMGRQQGSRVFGSNGNVSFDHRDNDRQKRRGVATDTADAGRVDRTLNGHVEKRSSSRSAVSNANGARASRSETTGTRTHSSGRPGALHRSHESLSKGQGASNRTGPPPRTPGQVKSRPTSPTPGRIQPPRAGPRSPATPARPTTPARPGAGPRPATPVRPPTRVGVASRPGAVRVTPASRAPRVQVVRYRTVRPYHGVFVYGPRPTRHDHYHGAPPARGHRVETSDLPTRTIDRDDSFALGLRMGSLISGYDDAAGYADLGFGGTMRFRPDEAVGLELAVSHYNQTFSDASERGQTLTSGSVELFAFPWSRVSPYVIGGVTWASGGFDDEVFVDGQTEQISMRRSAFGPHAGLGLEFALGQDVALDLEARYVGFLGHDAQDPTLPGGLTTTAGVLFHF